MHPVPQAMISRFYDASEMIVEEQSGLVVIHSQCLFKRSEILLVELVFFHAQLIDHAVHAGIRVPLHLRHVRASEGAQRRTQVFLFYKLKQVCAIDARFGSTCPFHEKQFFVGFFVAEVTPELRDKGYVLRVMPYQSSSAEGRPITWPEGVHDATHEARGSSGKGAADGAAKNTELQPTC